MATGDGAPWETQSTKDEGAEEGGGGGGQQAGDGYGTLVATQYHTGNGDGADEARCQHAWDRDGDDGATAPLQAAAGAACGVKVDAVGGRLRGAE